MHGFVEADVGNYSTFNYRSAINIPIIDEMLALRLGYQRMEREGFGHSAITGEHMGRDRNQHYFRGSLRLDLDTVRVRLVYDWLKSRENGPLVLTRHANLGTASADAAAVPAAGATQGPSARLISPIWAKAQSPIMPALPPPGMRRSAHSFFHIQGSLG